MSKVRIHQFHSGTAVGDAVTNSMFYIQEMLSEHEVASDIFAEHVDERLADRIKSIANFAPEPDDLLIVHHSMGHEIFPLIRALPCRKVLLYHNITPPSFFGPDSPFRHYARVGLAMLSDYKSIVEGAFADSAYNAEELVRRGYANVEVIPLLRDFGELRWREHDPRPYYFETPRYQLLFVGRICPNKGQLHLVRFMNAFRDAFDYPLHLTLVGHSAHGEGYVDQVLHEIEKFGLQDRIRITGHVTDEELYGHYRAADAYVSYSEHEGFGVPLLEAMAFDTPVIAYNSSAISGTLGSGGVLLQSTEPAELAGVLKELFADAGRRRALIRAQRNRLNDFSRAVVARKFLKFLEPHLPKGVVAWQPVRAAPAATLERTFMIEGPCETSYSLAIVNRNLALELDKIAGVQARLTAAEGMPNYQLMPEGLAKYPAIAPLLEPPPFDAAATEISIRNMYPLRPAGIIGDFRIAYFFWEESEIPASLARLINRYLDGLLAPTEFCRRAFRNSGIRLPIGTAGCGVNHLAVGTQRKVGGPNRRFTFGHVSSGMARKGVEELLLAFVTTFGAEDDVELLIKTHANASNIITDVFDRVHAGRQNAPCIKVIYEDLDDAEMERFYSLVDVMVMPTRGEGFNLPAAEAMARGLPVLVTGYSGQMDFCNDENSYLVDYHFELSGSHVNETSAMWVRVDLADLASKMRGLYQQRGDASMQNKAKAAQATGAGLTWAASARQVDSFAKELETPRRPQDKIKLGWVSTWNTECGIATYSQFLTENLSSKNFDLTIFANHVHTVGEDAANVQRVWADRDEPLDRLVAAAIDQKFDVIVFQYNYGFHRIADLAKAVTQLEAAGISTYVFFHKTEVALIDGAPESIADVASPLSRAQRLVVHAVDDVERLRSFGLVDNVVKIPHGAFRPTEVDPATMRSMLGLNAFAPIIATYGFLLPNKGLPEVILAFAEILGRYPNALLLMVNALYGNHGLSAQEFHRCRQLVADLGLDDKVIIVPEFLDDRESMNLLQAADLTVFAYQSTGESASGAVRYGLSALRPLVTTPLAIFRDVADMAHQARSIRATDIADAIGEVLESEELRARLVARQRAWLDAHNWVEIGERFGNMVVGLFEDRCNVRIVGAGDTTASAVKAPADAGNWCEGMQAEAFARIAYQRTLSRAPSPQEIADIVFDLRAGTATHGDILNRLAEAPSAGAPYSEPGKAPSKYKDIAFADLLDKADHDFVHTLYRELLGRNADEGGAAQYLHALETKAMSRAEMVRAFLNSDEFLASNRLVRVTSLPRA